MKTNFLLVSIFLIVCFKSSKLKPSFDDDHDDHETSFNIINSLSSRKAGRKLFSPIILVPGDGGSQLEAKLDKPDVPHYFCDKKTTYWFDLWLNLALLVPFVIDCWVDNMRLVYDNTSRATLNAPGVDLRVPGFGNTSSVEYVDPSQVRVSGYFNTLVASLVSIGYQRGVSLRGAPYDFRKAPNELHGFFDKFKDLIEESYQKNNNEKVIVVCHSLGCPNIVYFLNQQPQSWKDAFIKSLISLAGPWGGAVKAIKAFASGDNFGVVVVPSLTIRQDERTFPSLSYLMPTDRFWGHEEVLVEAIDRNYTVADYKDFFEDIDYLVGYDMWLDVRNLTYNNTPPGVEVHCLHGKGIHTMNKLIYNKKFPDSQPNIVYGDGDGTVNIRSLRGCLSWQGHQPHQVYYQNYSNIDHMLIMSDARVIKYIEDLAVRVV